MTKDLTALTYNVLVLVNNHIFLFYYFMKINKFEYDSMHWGFQKSDQILYLAHVCLFIYLFYLSFFFLK